MDPEQIYQEVLQEEKGKGVSPAVAEGRAKAARQRAVHGSPHPKEAKWWPGAQPHLDDGEGPAAEEEPTEQPEAEEPEAEEQPAEEQPAAAAKEAPAAEAPAEQPAAQEQPAAEAPAEQPAAAQAPQPAPTGIAAPPVPTPAPAYQPTIGTSPGSPTGNRLRPEDAVATEAQFAGQKAMDHRRKLIDDLVSTGVPAVTAAETGRSTSPWVSVLFLLIPLLAIMFLVGNDELRQTAGAEAGETTEQSGGGEGGGEGAVVTKDFAFEPPEVTLTGAELALDNQDTAPHNIYIYPDDESAQRADASQALFQGEDVAPGESTTYDVGDVKPGEYPFICQIHPNMHGTITVE